MAPAVTPSTVLAQHARESASLLELFGKIGLTEDDLAHLRTNNKARTSFKEEALPAWRASIPRDPEYIELDAHAIREEGMRNLLADTLGGTPYESEFWQESLDRLVTHFRLKRNAHVIERCLTEREMTILIMLYGLHNVGYYQPMTIKAVGEAFNLSQRRVTDLRDRAQSKLRQNVVYDLFQDSRQAILRAWCARGERAIADLGDDLGATNYGSRYVDLLQDADLVTLEQLARLTRGEYLAIPHGERYTFNEMVPVEVVERALAAHGLSFREEQPATA